MQPESNTLKKSTTPAPTSLVITCEHGGNRIPASYRHLFRGCRAVLESHRGFDPGALTLARAMAKKLDAPLLTSTVSRLVVDLNRSIGHKNLHMNEISTLPAEVRQEIIEHHYNPYRSQAERLVAEGISSRGRVVHISCHSFTNDLDGEVRHADIGLLYDPVRQGERDLCSRWKAALKVSAPGLTVRRNYPYQGRNDGLTSTLRKEYPPNAYIGIELELNQKTVAAPPRQWTALRESVITSLQTALRSHNP